MTTKAAAYRQVDAAFRRRRRADADARGAERAARSKARARASSAARAAERAADAAAHSAARADPERREAVQEAYSLARFAARADPERSAAERANDAARRTAVREARYRHLESDEYVPVAPDVDPIEAEPDYYRFRETATLRRDSRRPWRTRASSSRRP